ncbi:hypothetical protein COLO4_37366 [Corchorus olitorius]|uniref:F-box domain-containing protein n=1 Tax=Corchorus olitorius TaxID=93759 RepID=A0A1R3G2A3_9ROSI|nr:hypothetical protein COLO4_37366 [Corchorus olitorius]
MPIIRRRRSRASSSNSGQILSSSSAIIIASNDDILIQILVCLPPKSLLRFKTVSKHWLSLITDPKFKPKHNSKTISGLFACCLSRQSNAEYDFINLKSPNPSRPPFRSLNFVDDPLGVHILQSCNGLMLCRSYRANPQEATCYIYNPTTKQYTVLPGTQGSNDPSWDLKIIYDVKLAFDPSKSPYYKVICIYDSDLPNHYQMEIYSSKSGGPWKKLLGSPFTAPDNGHFSNGVYWNGAIHWFNVWGTSLCFDVEEEKFREIPMPTFRGDSRFRHLEESRGHLYLMEVIDDSDTLVYDLYEMERDYSGWFLKYEVDFHPIAAAFPEMFCDSDIYPYLYSILGIVQEECDDDSFLVLYIPDKAIRYNFKDGSFTMLHDFAPFRNRFEGSLEYHYAHQFIESFACV